MIPMIEGKVKQLQEEISRITAQIAQLSENIRKSKIQRDSLEEHASKLQGGLEAFQSTLNVMNSKKDEDKEIKSNVENIEARR